MIRRWPRSLAGRMALLLALALFVAQAVNFALLLRERRGLRLEQVTGPAVARLADAAARTDRSPDDRGRVHFQAADPARGLPAEPQVAAVVLAGLREAGVPVGRVTAALRPIDPADPPYRRRRGRSPPPGLDTEVVVAAHLPGRSGWLVTRSPWWGGARSLAPAPCALLRGWPRPCLCEGAAPSRAQPSRR